jgi:pimeloyl-ACP methyl ester carboxylesterase
MTKYKSPKTFEYHNSKHKNKLQNINSSYNKPKLILIGGFAINESLIKGFVEYLSQFFKIYYIDLPGHWKKAKTIKEVTLTNITKYVDRRIKKLKLKDYILSGISFGFLVASRTEAIKNAKGIAAIEPYIDYKKLRMNEFKAKVAASIINVICNTKNYKIAWDSKFLKIVLLNAGYKDNIIKLMLEQTDPKSFFEIMRIILTNKQSIKFYNKPYALIINKDDEFLNADKEIKEFKERARKLLLISSTSDHVPRNPTKSYFEKHLSRRDMRSIGEFINENS